jgi:hypothetical protein
MNRIAFDNLVTERLNSTHPDTDPSACAWCGRAETPSPCCRSGWAHTMHGCTPDEGGAGHALPHRRRPDWGRPTVVGKRRKAAR